MHEPSSTSSQETTQTERTSLRSVAQYTLVVVSIVAVALFLWQIVDALLLAFAAVLLAVFLCGCAHQLCQYTPLSSLWALGVVGIVLVGLLGTFTWLVGPSLIDQGNALTQRLPDALHQIQHFLQQSPWGQYVLRYLTAPKGGLSQGVHLFSRMTGLASTVFDLLTNLFLILFAGIFFAINPALYQRGVLLLTPQSQTVRVCAALEATGQALWQWLMGKLLAMSFVGVFVAVGLLLIGVPMALVLGLIASLLDFVPLIGPLVAALPGILLALTLGPSQALYTGLCARLADRSESCRPPGPTAHCGAAARAGHAGGGCLRVTLWSPWGPPGHSPGRGYDGVGATALH